MLLVVNGMEPVDLIVSIVLGAVYGAMYAGVGYWAKRGEGEPLEPRKALRTVAIFTAAGVLVSLRHGEIERELVQQATAEVAVVGIVFDMVWSKARREGWLPSRLTSAGAASGR